VPPEDGLGRQSRPDRIGKEGVEFQTTVLDGYRQLAEKEPGRVFIIDAGQGFDQVVEAAWTILEEHVHA
jgi:thymidylate kinase